MLHNRSVVKAQKHIAAKKKKGSSTNSKPALHANSRDAHRLQRAALRDDRVSRVITSRSKSHAPLLQRVGFFRVAASKRAPQQSFTEAEVHEMIRAYISLNRGELEDLQRKRRLGRPRATREDVLMMQEEAEEKEYRSGFWMPDMRDEGNLEKLREWEGQWAGLNVLTFVRVPREGTAVESKFPPREG